jgi:thiol-disulfide isomerase/thioredoxin
MTPRLLALILLALTPAAIAWDIDAGDTAPNWSSKDFRGQSVSFPAIANGKPAVILFWTTWCNYCQAFTPYLKVIQNDYAEHGVQIIAINAKEKGIGDPKAYLENITYPVVGILEGDDIAAAYDIQFIPGLMVVDGTGMVSYRRASTDLPPGKTLAEIWDSEIREALDLALN